MNTKLALNEDFTIESGIGGILKAPNVEASQTKTIATEDWVNTQISTATATFRGTYNLVSQLGLTIE